MLNQDQIKKKKKMKFSTIITALQLVLLAQAQTDNSVKAEEAAGESIYDLLKVRSEPLYVQKLERRSNSSSNSTKSNGSNSSTSTSSEDGTSSFQQSTKSSSSPGSRLWSEYSLHGAAAGVLASFLLA